MSFTSLWSDHYLSRKKKTTFLFSGIGIIILIVKAVFFLDQSIFIVTDWISALFATAAKHGGEGGL